MNRSASPELSLLIASCLDSGSYQTQKVESKQLFNLLHFHQVRPVLLSYIHRNRIDVDFKPQLTEYCKQITFSNMLSAQELVKAAGMLTAKGINVYAYKGCVWADWLYSNIGQREFGDIDLLISRNNFSEAVDVLTGEAGYLVDDYRRYLLETPWTKQKFFETDYHIPMFKSTEDSSVLEAHWEVAYPRLLFTFPSEEWAEYTEKYSFLGNELNVFHKEYQFLLLLVHHGGKEQWRKLKYIADLAAYMSRYGDSTNWDKVSILAHEKGIFSLYKWSLGLLKGLGSDWQKEWPQITSIDATPLIKYWEAMPRESANSSWRYFKHGLAIHDGLRHKSNLLWRHLKYFSEFKLLWHKAIWYATEKARSA